LAVVIATISQAAEGTGLGTGFAVNSEGYIIINNHVVTEKVKLADSKAMFRECNCLEAKSDTYHGAATIVGRDPANDLALIKVTLPAPASATPSAPMAKRAVDSTWRRLSDELADRSRQGEGGNRTKALGADFVRFASTPTRPGEPINLFGFPLGDVVSSQLKVSTGIVAAKVRPVVQTIMRPV
jgi:hypothetical protein